MTKGRRLIVACAVMLAGGFAWWFLIKLPTRPGSPTPATSPLPDASGNSSQESAETTPATPGAHAILDPRQSKFAAMGVLEANAFLTEISRKDLTSIFRLWLDSGRVEHDRAKQGSLGTVMAGVMQERGVPPEFAAEIQEFIVNTANPDEERRNLIGILSSAATRESVEILLRAHATLSDMELKHVAARAVGKVGTLWGDGTFHEERSPPLEEAWRGTEDPELLTYAALAIAQIGAPSGIEMLLAAALTMEGPTDTTTRAAQYALRKVYTRNAVPPVAALLAKHSTLNPASELAASILLNVGDVTASDALVNWLQQADASAASFARMLVLSAPKGEFPNTCEAALVGNEPFRDATVRESIRIAVEEYRRNHGG